MYKRVEERINVGDAFRDFSSPMPFLTDYITTTFRSTNYEVYRMHSNGDNIIPLTYQLVKVLKVKANLETVADYLDTHPYFPSLVAIHDCLTRLKVSSEAYQINKGSDKISDLKLPVLISYPNQIGNFALLTHVDSQKVILKLDKRKSMIVPLHIFLKYWDGVYLIAEAGNGSGEQNFVWKRRRILITKTFLPCLIIIFLAISLKLLLNNHASTLSIYLYLTKLVGVVLTTILLNSTFIGGLRTLEKFCRIAGNNNCKSILQSDAAKVMGGLSWSEIGFFYFSGTFIALLLFPTLLPVLGLLSLLALFYPVYSFSFQYLNNTWCILCCIIQTVLMLEALLYLTMDHPVQAFPIIDFGELVNMLVCFAIPVLIWFNIKTLLNSSISNKPLQRIVNTFKTDYDVFSVLLNKQEKFSIDKDLHPIILGAAAGIKVITIISDPYCEPCARTHTFFHNWLEESKNISVQLLFYIRNQDENLSTIVARHMMALDTLGDKLKLVSALHDWYGMTPKNYKLWAQRYPVSITNEIIEACDRQKKWRKSINLNFTPTILINGNLKPEIYSLEDLKYLIK